MVSGLHTHTQVLIRSSSFSASSFPSSSFSFLVMVKCAFLPPRKVPLEGHVPQTLPTKLLAWSLANPVEWQKCKAYAEACTRPEHFDELLKHLEHWSATRPKEGELDAVFEEYSGFLDKAELCVCVSPRGSALSLSPLP